jgi:hypothetical protein
MATNISQINDILTALKSREVVFASDDIPESFCKIGLIQAGIALKKDFTVEEISGEYYITSDITGKEIYLAGIYAYRNYATQEHDTMRLKAMNFKTISFAVTGLTERAKETMRIVWWCDNEIERVLNSLEDPVGSASEMKGE